MHLANVCTREAMIFNDHLDKLVTFCSIVNYFDARLINLCWPNVYNCV